MRTTTLGYEDDTQISKSDIARTQLTEAIALFLGEKFLSAITLAGAAEDIDAFENYAIHQSVRTRWLIKLEKDLSNLFPILKGL